MDRTQIDIDNKMIMEWMGWPTSESDDWGVARSSTVEKTMIDKDWRLLMAVVDKVEKAGYSVAMEGNSCIIYNLPLYNEPIILQESKQQAVYISLVKVIKNQIINHG